MKKRNVQAVKHKFAARMHLRACVVSLNKSRSLSYVFNTQTLYWMGRHHHTEYAAQMWWWITQRVKGQVTPAELAACYSGRGLALATGWVRTMLTVLIRVHVTRSDLLKQARALLQGQDCDIKQYWHCFCAIYDHHLSLAALGSESASAN